MKTLVLMVVLGVIAGCAARAPAPVDDRRSAPVAAPKPPVAQAARTPAPAPRPVEYVVKRGDTLYSIALEQGVDYRELARANRIDDPSKLRIGQTLQLAGTEDRAGDSATGGVSIGAARGAGPVESRPLERPGAGATAAATDPSIRTFPKAVRLPYSEQNLALLSQTEPAAAPKPAAMAPLPPAAVVAPKPEPQKSEVRDPDAIEFVWPTKGRIVANFSEPNNKGLDIAGKLGDPVVAAAPGRVIYTGSGIRGLGKLIVIRHDNNFQSVYAHNREITVKEGDTVARGQKIAELGDTDADSPKLHFEIRKSGKPVDPARYLPSG